jgi:uncharacterized protein affecting Mg2+/Co2+ transport
MRRYQFQVEVLPRYLPEQSDPDGGLFMFSYTITITNARYNGPADASGHAETRTAPLVAA